MQHLALAIALSFLSLGVPSTAQGIEPSSVSLPVSLTHAPQARTKSISEALALRRMANFLLSGEMPIAKEQGLAILRAYPDSEYLDTVRSWLGDISFCQGDWRGALKSYEQIAHTPLRLCRFPHQLHCHFALRDWSAIEVLSQQPLWNQVAGKSHDVLSFYLAEALLRGQERALVTTAGEFRQIARARRRALALYGRVGAAAYRLKCLEAQAWLYSQLNLREESERCFDELERLDPNHGATLRFDPLRALLTTCQNDYLEKLGQVPSQASWPVDMDQRVLQWMALSFDLGHYQLLIRDAGEFSQILSERAQPMCDFLVARSLFALGRQEQSGPYFERFLNAAQSGELAESATQLQQRRSALLSLFQIGSQTRRVDLMTFGIRIWRGELPPTPELAQALFCRAQMLAGDDPQAALDDLESLLRGHFDSPLVPDALAGAIALSSDLKRWSQCANCGVDFIQRYPRYPQLQALGPRIVEAMAQNIAQRGDRVDDSVSRELMALQSLRESSLLSPAVESKWFLDLAHRLKQLHCQEVSRHWLELVCESGDRAQKSSRGGDYSEIFRGYVQSALEKASESQSAESLATSLTLFNQCLQQLTMESSQSGPTAELAAACLTRALESEDSQIATENLIWLGDHYYDQIFPDPLPLSTAIVAEGRIDPPTLYLPKLANPDQQIPLAKKGIAAFGRLLRGRGESWQEFPLALDSQSLEQSALRCSRLLGCVGSCQEQLSVLQHLRDQYAKAPDQIWPRQERALFELALSADALQASSVAVAAYQQVIQLGVMAPQLRDWMTWRMAYHQVNCAVGRESSAAAQNREALQTLRQLQARRTAAFEPLYLEAALTLADALARSGGPPGPGEIGALDAVKKTFAQSDDIAAKDYLEALRSSPRGEKLFFHYMTWIDAKIALLQCQSAPSAAPAKLSFGIALLRFLAAVPTPAPLIQERAQSCLQQIDSSGGADAR